MSGADTILVVGTASHVGKSAVCAGLCRLLADRGYDVAPFKAQNMSNNARVAVTPSGSWGEIGVSQYVQARAARVPATTDMNPVLLKPRGEGESQVIVDGEPIGHRSAAAYYEEGWETAVSAAEAAHARLASEYDVIVAEGAGGAAEPNLAHRDLANRETARFADAAVLVLADIERGGAFASLYGTLELAPAELRERVVGAAITKFRGDRDVLAPALDDIEARTGVPILGVLPYDDPGLPEEDSVGLPDGVETVGADEVPDSRSVHVAVPRLPRISNFTDLEPLAREPGVRIRYVDPDDPIETADAVVLPGTKNTVDDLRTLRAAGFGDRLAAFDGPIVGICGGYQLLGERLTNAHVEGTGDGRTLAGFGLLPVETRFSRAKRVERVSYAVDGVGPLAGAAGRASGYEIHAGETRATESVARPIGPQSAASGRVLGTYLHGLFENRFVREAFCERVFGRAGTEPPARGPERVNPYDAAATLVETHLDVEALLASVSAGTSSH
ncbi:cobyric acid synthase [Halovivax limisalsi]|uniref:cobyric acid synthase n=1 Tax=Halovivax limisalsi TaxID=1453760 RepID=UPI001FFC967E|nr:cobyric acid synthase [Halovivax limisalsi]